MNRFLERQISTFPVRVIHKRKEQIWGHHLPNQRELIGVLQDSETLTIVLLFGRDF